MAQDWMEPGYTSSTLSSGRHEEPTRHGPGRYEASDRGTGHQGYRNEDRPRHNVSPGNGYKD